MDLVQKEHDRLQKRLKASQAINNVQSTIDLLQQARDAIAEGQYGITRVAPGKLPTYHLLTLSLLSQTRTRLQSLLLNSRIPLNRRSILSTIA